MTAARQIENESNRTEALDALAPRLTFDLLAEAMVDVSRIEDDHDRYRALTVLESYLAPNNTLNTASPNKKPTPPKASDSLAPSLPSDLLTETLAYALRLPATGPLSHLRTEALVALAPQLPPDLLLQALSAAGQTGDKNNYSMILPKALAAARQIEYELDRTRALATLAPLLPSDEQSQVWHETLYYARQIASETNLHEVLIALAPRLPGDLLPELLDTGCQIENEAILSETLVGISPYLPPSLLSEALNAIGKFKDESTRSRTLADIAPFLPLRLLAKSVSAACQIKHQEHRTAALAAIVPHVLASTSSPLYPHWAATLMVIARRTRRDLLQDLCVLAPILHALGGPDAVAETFRAIQDVGEWWP